MKKYPLNREETYSKILELVHSGCGSRQISNKLDISQTTMLKIFKRFADVKEKQLLSRNNEAVKLEKGISEKTIRFIQYDLNQAIYFILHGWTTKNVCVTYNISYQTLRKTLSDAKYIKYSTFDKSLLNKCLNRLYKNDRQAARINGVKNGKAKKIINAGLMEIIKEFLEHGMSSKAMKQYFLDQGVSICHTSIINTIKQYGTSNDLDKLKINARNIQAETVKLLLTNKTSLPEQMLRDIVRIHFPEAAWKFPVKGSNGYFWEIDVALVDKQVAFEYDCTYWHNKARDAYRDRDLKSKGWSVYRFVYTKNPTYETLMNDFLSVLRSNPNIVE